MTIQEKLLELCTKEVMSCSSVQTCSSVPWNHVTYGFMRVLSLMKPVNGRQQTMRMQAQSMNYYPKEKLSLLEVDHQIYQRYDVKLVL